MIKLEKLAMPLAFVVARGEPERVAVEHAGVPKLIATSTFGIAAPVASNTCTCTAGEIDCEPTALLGCTTNAICAGCGRVLATTMVKDAVADRPSVSVAVTEKE
jgi:hypothetical protein